MAEAATPSDLSEKCKFIQDVSALILKQFRKGCLCSIQTRSFAQLVAKSFDIINNDISNVFKSTQNNDISDDSVSTQNVETLLTKTLLSFLSCLRTLLRTLVQLDSLESGDGDCDEDDSTSEGTVCKHFHEWILILVRLKFDLLAGLSKLWSHSQDSSDLRHLSFRHPNLRHLTESTFHLILTSLPCPSRTTSGDTCRKTCQKIIENFVQLKSKNPDLGTSLIYSIFCQLEKDLEDDKKKQKGRIIFDCRSAQIRIKCNSRIHFHSVKQFATNELKLHWRSWMERCLDSPEDHPDKNYSKLEILTLWKSLVSVTSNLGYSQSREFVSSARQLVQSVAYETNHLIKQKEIDILNEVLCYGTTLSIQSTIPCEVSDLAQELLRQAKSVPFSEFKIPLSFPGFGGNQIKLNVEDEEDQSSLEEAPSLGAIQGLVLLHLKASAIVVREAQCCSSSDSSASDSSLSSHGSSSIGDAEQEMKMIERNVMNILGKLKVWIIGQLELHPTSQLSQCITVLFNEQDDALIESLLCLLDIFTGLHFGVYSSRHFGGPTIELETVTDSSNLLQEVLDPLDGFDSFLQTISCDASVILDFLLSNETCFLLYFLRLLKYLSKNSSTSPLHLHPERTSIVQVLKKVHVSIRKLTQKSLFPYEISPVLKQLEKLVPIYQSTSRELS